MAPPYPPCGLQLGFVRGLVAFDRMHPGRLLLVPETVRIRQRLALMKIRLAASEANRGDIRMIGLGPSGHAASNTDNVPAA